MAGDLCCSVFELNVIPSKAGQEQAGLTALCTVLAFSGSNNVEKHWEFHMPDIKTGFEAATCLHSGLFSNHKMFPACLGGKKVKMFFH